MEIKKEDIVKLVLQFLYESGYQRSFTTLQDESNVTLNLIDGLEELKSEIEQGRWDRVLRLTSKLRIKQAKLMLLYEIIICELLELNERQTALAIYNEIIVPQKLNEVFKEKCLRLDYLIRKPGEVSLLTLYEDKFENKQKRRNYLFDQLAEEITQAPPSRLLELIGNALRHQYGKKDLTKLDILLGTQTIVEEKQDKVIHKVHKIVKYSEDTRIQVAKFSVNGNHLITGSVDGIIEVWDPIEMKVRLDLPYQAEGSFMAHKLPIVDFDLSKDNEFLITADQQFARIWKFNTGDLLKTLPNTHPRPLNNVLFYKDPQDVLLASQDIHVINLKSASILKQFIGHNASINHLCFSQSYSQLYTGSDDQTVRVWDFSTTECVFLFKAEARVSQIVKHPLKMFIICTQSRNLTLVNPAMNVIKQFQLPETQKGEFQGCAVSIKGHLIYGLTSEGFVFIFDTNKGTVVNQFEVQADNLIMNPKKNQIFCYNGKGQLMFYK